jgi:hypothetical protein
MTLAERVQLATSFSMLGLIWLIQLVHYPGFHSIEASKFSAFHAMHSSKISLIVAPLMLAELGAAVFLCFQPPVLGVRIQAVLLVLTLVAWLSTFFLQVPLHGALGNGNDSETINRLVQTNWIRTAAWTVKAVVLFVSLR